MVLRASGIITFYYLRFSLRLSTMMLMKFPVKSTLYNVFLLLATFRLLSQSSMAVPVEGECLQGTKLSENCQRCAKFTKDVNLFALCCVPEDDYQSSGPRKQRSVRSWCMKFLDLKQPYYESNA